jgi:hypothetical protein
VSFIAGIGQVCILDRVAQETQREGPPVEDVFDPRKHDDLAKAVARLSPDEALFFLSKLEAAVTKRKIQLTGYLVAMVVWLAGMVGALAYYGTHDGFVGWIFLVPFGLVGLVLWGFGRWSERAAESIRITAARRAADKPAAAE